MNPNDEIRQKILQYFYDRNLNATSKYGKKGSSVKISDCKKELKQSHNLSQSQVVSNLTYLIDQGWVKTFNVEKTINVKGGTIPSVVTWYEITADGIDKIEGESEFQSMPKYNDINISATGSNVITLGDGNIVNVKHQELHSKLDALKDAISTENKLTESKKLDLSVDIESIKDQLAKENPNKTIIQHLWNGIEKTVTTGTLVELIAKISPLIANLL